MRPGMPLRTSFLLSSWLVVVASLFAALVMGGLVYHKAVRLRQGDQDVFFRAGWSIRQGGADLYEITDDHGFHYHYPPLFAILMAPLANPPSTVPAAERHAVLPSTARVLLLYAVNLACLVGSIVLLTRCSNYHPGDGRKRLHLLIWPVVVCLPAIGLTLIRGQVDLILVLLIACFIAALASDRNFLAGLCLAVAISIKIIPAFLLILPLWRRDGRCLMGSAVGLFLGLVALPCAFLGTARTIDLYSRQLEVVLGPGMGSGEDRSRAHELLDARATVNQSFQMVIHLTLYYGQREIPARPAAWVRGAHWLMVALLTGLLLWRHGRRVVWDARQLLCFTSLLSVLMVLASPVCHLHYFTLTLPLTIALSAAVLEGRISRLWAAAPLVALAGYTAFMLPPLVQLRDLGIPMYSTMALWLAGWWALRQGAQQQASAPSLSRRAA